MLGTDNQLQKSIVPGVFPQPLSMTVPADRLQQPQQQDDLLLYRLYRIHATARPLVVRLCERDYGITRREWRVLSCLAAAEGVQSSELAERAMLDRARTSRAITGLSEKGLVRREPKPSDRREVHLFLTDEGRRVHAEVFPRIATIQRHAAARCPGRRTRDRRQRRLRPQALACRAASMAWVSAGLFGSTALAKLRTVCPSRAIRYLWKFHCGTSLVAAASCA